MDDWNDCGSSVKQRSPVTTAIDALGVGETVTFDAPKYLGCNVPASAAARLQKATKKVFQWRRNVGNAEQVDVKRIY